MLAFLFCICLYAGALFVYASAAVNFEAALALRRQRADFIGMTRSLLFRMCVKSERRQRPVVP